MNDEQQATLRRLEEEDKKVEREHQERMRQIDEEIRQALVKRKNLKGISGTKF